MLHSRAHIAWDLRTPDLAVIRRSISAFLKPFSIEASASGPYDARICHRRLHDTELTLIDYGNSIRLDAGRMKSFHLVHIPLRGGYWFEADGERLHVGIGQAHVIQPDLHLRMDWSSACQLLVLRTTDSRLTECAAQLKAGSGRGSVLSCVKGPGASLGRTVEFLAGELMAGGLLRTRTAAAETADSLLIDALLHAISSTAQRPTGEQNDYVALAQRYIVRNLKSDLSSAAIAAACGLSPRSLFRACRALLGTSPMAWARNLRLQRVRAELLRTDLIDRTISQIASDWGFTHFGHFCEAYRRLYRETPTDTRRVASAAQPGFSRRHGDAGAPASRST
ncbi:MAG TPA: AraC family transcriptional regulator [Steroidobacteraceae bacterium]|nr:AraC family transcriptional regulator [Steroidobacteraceae bacterium]